MSIIIRVLVIAACAYAGSTVATIQFPDVPDSTEKADGKSLFVDRADQ
jgi:hypothetical protein